MPRVVLLCYETEKEKEYVRPGVFCVCARLVQVYVHVYAQVLVVPKGGV